MYVLKRLLVFKGEPLSCLRTPEGCTRHSSILHSGHIHGVAELDHKNQISLSHLRVMVTFEWWWQLLPLEWVWTVRTLDKLYVLESPMICLATYRKVGGQTETAGQLWPPEKGLN